MTLIMQYYEMSYGLNVEMHKQVIKTASNNWYTIMNFYCLFNLF